MTTRNQMAGAPVHVRLTDRETCKTAYSGYVTPDENGTLHIEGLAPGRQYDFIVTKPEQETPKYPVTFTSD